MSNTSAVDTRTQAVSPLSILGGTRVRGRPGRGREPASVRRPRARSSAQGRTTPSRSPLILSVSLLPVLLGHRVNHRGSERALVPLAGAYPDRRIHWLDEDLAVTDIAGLGRSREDPSDLVDEVVRHHDLDLDLGEEVDRVLTAAVELGVALLATEPPNLGDRHADDPDAGQCFLDVVELERLDDGFDLFHVDLPGRLLCTRRAGGIGAARLGKSDDCEETLPKDGRADGHSLGRALTTAFRLGS